jgi:large repetitive protein
VTVSGTAEPGALVELFEGATSRGTATTGSGGLWSRTLTGLSDGSHSYTATARDAAGNTSGASNSRTVVVDTTAPNTVLTTGPLGATSSTSASFTFTADDPSASFECRLDGGAWTACSSPRTYATLTEGSHTFEVRATDAAGNTDQMPALRTWTVDTAPPAPPVITGPAEGATSSSGTLTVSGTAEPGSIVEFFDGAASKGVTATSLGGSWSKVVSGLADGAHAFTAVATDAAGNASSLSSPRTVVVDTTFPDTSIETGPSNPTTATDATFEFAANEPGAAFQCRLDGGAWATCSSPETRGTLAEGAHAFEVRAIDAVGNTDASPAMWTWSVDLTAPQTTVESGPADPTTETQADFTFSADDPSATFECSLDGGGWAPCSSPEALTGLAAGTHIFEARAVDPAGNVDPTPAAHTWTVT